MAAVEQNGFDFGILNAAAVDLSGGDQHALDKLFLDARYQPPAIKWEPSVDDLPRDGLRFLLTHWQGMATNGALPLADDLDPIDLRPALGNIMLVDVLDDGRDFRYRLYGSAIAFISSGDKTGKSVIDFEGIPAQFFYVVYRAALIRRCPVYTHHYPANMSNFRRWHRLLLPLSDKSGNVVRYLIGCYADPKSEALNKT